MVGMRTKLLKDLLNDLLKYQLRVGCLRRNRGFTLIELLVALIIAVLVVSGLLSFVVSISNIERRELAKANAQQDIQDAVDYIVRDLQEAVFIYDTTGLATLAPRIPPTTGVTGCNSAVATTLCQPVLAFWKRRQLDRCDQLPSETAGTNVRVGVVTSRAIADTPAGNRPTPANINTQCSDNIRGNERGDDAFVYAFVAYYIIRDTVPNTTAPWSRAARIGRFEVRGGIPNPTVAAPLSGQPDLRYTTTPAIPPQAGYQDFTLPDITPATTINDIITQMNRWRETGATAFTGNQVQILTDFVDDTITTSPQHTNILTPVLPIRLDNTGSNPPTAYGQADQDCQSISRGTMGAQAVRVPANLTVGTQLSSFYACVNANRTSARVYLRGTAMARLFPRAPLARRSITSANLPFFPTAEARVLGRGLFVPNQ